VAEGVNALNTTDEQFTVIVNESVAVVDKTMEIINNETEKGMSLGISYDTQIKRYDDRKRRFTIVYGDVYVRTHDNYDRIRAVGHPFGRDRITAVNQCAYTA